MRKLEKYLKEVRGRLDNKNVIPLLSSHRKDIEVLLKMVNSLLFFKVRDPNDKFIEHLENKIPESEGGE